MIADGATPFKRLSAATRTYRLQPVVIRSTHRAMQNCSQAAFVASIYVPVFLFEMVEPGQFKLSSLFWP
jgi:hypothetical protein